MAGRTSPSLPSRTASRRPCPSTGPCGASPPRRLSEEGTMADLRSEFLGIKSPNPFWLASAPPTDREINVVRAFRAGWGGVVWKTLGEDGPPIVNVSSRYGALNVNGQRMAGLNNIELITDRPL